jgi:hypothetical protein
VGTDLRLAWRVDGAWLVWSTPAGSGVPPTLFIGRLDEDGFLQDPFEWNVPFEPGSVAVASFEEFLAVAWVQAEPEGASPHVQVFAPDGEPRGAIKVAATGGAKGPLAFIGSPQSRSATLVWSENAGGGVKDQLRFTRVDCIDGN